MNLVSIIIPTFGDGEKLLETIESAFNQTYPKIEVIVVDDNGKNSIYQKKNEKMLKDYINYDNFKYIILGKHKNGSAARNIGAIKSKGRYLNFIDDDDALGLDKINEQVKLLDNLPEIWGASYSSRITLVNGIISKKTYANKSGEILFDYLMHNVVIGTGALLLRKSVWEDLNGFDETFSRHQDWEFVTRLLQKYKIVASKNVHFVRNYTGINSPKLILDYLKLLDYFTLNRVLSIKSLSNNKIKRINSQNYMGIMLKAIRVRDFKTAFSIFKLHSNGIYGIYYSAKLILQYLYSTITKSRYT